MVWRGRVEEWVCAMGGAGTRIRSGYRKGQDRLLFAPPASDLYENLGRRLREDSTRGHPAGTFEDS